jgi:hypothetical protein
LRDKRTHQFINMINPLAGFGRSTTQQAREAAASHGVNAPRADAPRSGMAANISAVFSRAGQSLSSVLGRVCHLVHRAGDRISAAIRSVFGCRSKAASEGDGTETGLKSALRGTEHDLKTDRSAKTVRFDAEARMVEFGVRQRVNLVATLSRQVIPTKDEAVPMHSPDTTVTAPLRATVSLLLDGDTASLKDAKFSISDPTFDDSGVHWASSRGVRWRKHRQVEGGDEPIYAVPKAIVDQSRLQ